jgi:hypothetical protein
MSPIPAGYAVAVSTLSQIPGMPSPRPEASSPVRPPTDPRQIVPPPGLLEPVVPHPASVQLAAPPSPVAADLDHTVVVARRHPVAWALVTDDGSMMPLTAASVVLGRAPAGSGAGEQELAVPDATRTLSKVHARLDLVDGVWVVTDLVATNGVIVRTDGADRLLDPGTSAPVSDRFMLGRVGLRLVALDDGTSP